MSGTGDTTPAMLRRASDLGREAGLRYVYAGNIPGIAGRLEDTRCPSCGATLIERRGFSIFANRLTADGACPGCGTRIPGRWHPAVANAPARASQDAGHAGPR